MELVIPNYYCFDEFLGINRRGSPGPLRDHPSFGDLSITRLQPTVIRESDDDLFKRCHRL
jgi:hypothetical protein